MNFIKKAILLIFIFCTATVYALPNESVLYVTQAFKTEDATQLSNYFNDNIELTISSVDNFFTKQQARSIIAKFFKTENISDFLVNRTEEKDNAIFLIGTIATEYVTYRTSILFKKNGTQFLIYQLRIENTNE